MAVGIPEYTQDWNRRDADAPDADESAAQSLERHVEDVADCAADVLAGVQTTAVSLNELRQREKRLCSAFESLCRQLGFRVTVSR